MTDRDNNLRQETALLDALERRPAPGEGADPGYAAERATFDGVVQELAFLAPPAAPPAALRARLLRRVAREAATRAEEFPTGHPAGAEEVLPGVMAVRTSKAEWIAASIPGVAYKVLGRDPEKSRTTRLVRFSPGMRYPRHRHAGTEEIFLIEGELSVNGASLKAGDYCRSEPGSEERDTFTDVGALAMIISSDLDEIVAS